MELTDGLIYYWMSVSGVSSRKANKLLGELSPYDIWDGLEDLPRLRDALGEKHYAALLRFKNEEFLMGSMERLANMGISYITRDKFPTHLSQSEVDPPLMLYYRGDISLLDTPSVAVVGTRACSSYGKEAAGKITRELCERGVTVVSGLASGIDTYAHRAALKAGGKTVAVLGSGLNRVTPTPNISLFEEIVNNGGLAVSEYSPNSDATRYTFPERNRIISGLSKGVIVVEAGEKSGALITAEFAEEQGRTVFAVPGNITSQRSVGPNRLLFDGATPALSGEDICYTLGISAGNKEKISRAIQLDIFEQKIYNILQSGETSFDTLVEKSELPPHKLSAILSSLEIQGIIVKLNSNIYRIEV